MDLIKVQVMEIFIKAVIGIKSNRNQLNIMIKVVERLYFIDIEY